MKGDLRLLLLQIIQLSATTTQEIAIALTEYGKTNSYRRLRHLPVKLPTYKPILEKQIARLKEKQKVYKIIYKLKTDGLVTTVNGLVEITKKGIERIAKLKSSEKVAAYSNLKTSSDEFKIIIFDIPESQRRDRDWLRDVLRILGFTFLQKSVWVGKSKIPEKFLQELGERSIIDYVEIFAITKRGTLKQIQ